MKPLFRRYVERFLDGGFDQNELSNLFLFARDQKDAPVSTREIGHFIAHRGERVQGFVTDEAKGMYSIFAVQTDEQARNPDLASMPSEILTCLNASFVRLPHAAFRSSGLKRSDVKQTLSRIADRAQTLPTGRVSLLAAGQDSITHLEAKVLNLLLGNFVVRAAFRGNQIFSEFTNVLVNHELVKKIEVERFQLNADAVQLYVLTLMHGVSIVMPNGIKTTLRLSVTDNTPDQTLEIHFGLPISRNFGGAELLGLSQDKPFFLFTPLVITDLRSAEHCNPEFIRIVREIGLEDDRLYIELSSNRRLSGFIAT